MNIDCNEFIQNYSEKAATLIMQWAAEHHRKTYAEDFFEKFPNAIKNEDGLPLVSIFDIYGEVNNDAWWESPMPAEESWRDKVNKLDWGEEF
jgi:hypothetical protein